MKVMTAGHPSRETKKIMVENTVAMQKMNLTSDNISCSSMRSEEDINKCRKNILSKRTFLYRCGITLWANFPLVQRISFLLKSWLFCLKLSFFSWGSKVKLFNSIPFFERKFLTLTLRRATRNRRFKIKLKARNILAMSPYRAEQRTMIHSCSSIFRRLSAVWEYAFFRGLFCFAFFCAHGCFRFEQVKSSGKLMKKFKLIYQST